MNELINQFDTSKIDEKKFQDIKGQVTALKLGFEEDLIELRSLLFDHKTYSFVYDDQRIANIFRRFTESVILAF